MESMEVHMKPSMREKSHHIILHVGTNDLNRNRAPNLIAKSINDLAYNDEEQSSMYCKCF